jgi:hypothetical protein
MGCPRKRSLHGLVFSVYPIAQEPPDRTSYQRLNELPKRRVGIETCYEGSRAQIVRGHPCSGLRGKIGSGDCPGSIFSDFRRRFSFEELPP